MDKNYGGKGDELMAEAKKKLKGSFFGNMTSNKSERAQEALEIYKQAATSYKLAKRWEDAVKAYLECVQCDGVAKNGDAAEYYIEAANMAEKINTAESIKYFQKAIECYIKNNRIAYAAKTNKRIAELYQNDKEFTLATKYYQEAADNYQAEKDNVSNYNNCMLKIVDLAVFLPEIDYSGTIKILDSVAQKYLNNKLTAPSAKDLYFKAVLLHLAHDDTIGASQALQNYTNNDPTFFNTRQQKFLAAIIKAVNEKNIKAFAEECFQFNQIIPLDKWKTTILTKVKALIPQQNQVIAAGGETPQKQQEW